MLIAYRVAYGLVLLIFLGNVFMASRGATASTFALMAAAGVLLCCVLGSVIAFARIRPASFWALVLVWEVLFVWYAWFSPVAPFVLHEVHALESGRSCEGKRNPLCESRGGVCCTVRLVPVAAVCPCPLHSASAATRRRT